MDKNNLTKRYSNGEITVVWQSGKCIHSGNCARGLANVFRPREKPWISMEGGSSAQIRTTVSTCPSGALTIEEEKA